MRENPHTTPVDWRQWNDILTKGGEDGPAEWEAAVLEEMRDTAVGSDCWPDAVHDALAAAGKEMSRLGEERQRRTNEFSDWLGERLLIDKERFSGVTHIRGGQADFDQMGWEAFSDMLTRNRRACGVELTAVTNQVKKKYESAAMALAGNRERFSALDAAINRIVWQLVGLGPDGDLRDA